MDSNLFTPVTRVAVDNWGLSTSLKLDPAGCICRRIYKNKINTHIHSKIRKFPLPGEIHVFVHDFVYSREFENNTHISRLTYLSR